MQLFVIIFTTTRWRPLAGKIEPRALAGERGYMDTKKHIPWKVAAKQKQPRDPVAMSMTFPVLEMPLTEEASATTPPPESS